MQGRLKSTLRVLLQLSRLVIAGLAIWLIGIPLRSIWAHNQILKQYEQAFQKIRHPSNTIVLARDRRVIRSPGNGQRCFYFVGEVRQVMGQQADIRASYQHQPVTIEFLQNGRFSDSVPYGMGQLELWKLQPAERRNNLYLAYTLDTDWTFSVDEHVIDLRCH
jgi:hypothetical protein